MQKKIEETLFKERSPRATLSAGMRLYMGNFRRVFKSTWIAGLVAAVISGLACTAAYVYWPGMIAKIYSDIPHAWMYAQEYMILLVVIATLLLLSMLAVSAFFGSGGASILKLQLPVPVGQWKMIWRSIKGFVFNALIFVIMFGAVAAFVYWRRDMFSQPTMSMVSIGATILLLCIVSVLLLPMAYITTKYLMDRTTSFCSLLFSSYGTSMRYWARQFIILLVCAIILGLFFVVSSMPEYILSEANWQARVGVVGGDPLGMPSYITPLTFITCTVISFLQLYIWLPILFVLYYLYGSIDAREDGKHQKQEINN